MNKRKVNRLKNTNRLKSHSTYRIDEGYLAEILRQVIACRKQLTILRVSTVSFCKDNIAQALEEIEQCVSKAQEIKEV